MTSARTRLVFVGVAIVILLAYFAIAESLVRLIGFAIGLGVYSLVLVSIESGLGAGGGRSNDVFGAANALSVTMVLTLAGQLGGPLVGIYGILILGSTLASGMRGGVITATLGSSSWLIALGATWAGWVAGLQPTLALTPSDPLQSLATGGVVFAFSSYCAWAYARVATERLCEAENRYRTVLEATHQPILLVDPETGRYVDANRAATGDIAGGSYERLLDLTVFDILDESEHAEMRAVLDRVARRGPRPLSDKARSSVGADCGDVVSATCKIEGRPILVVAGRA